MKIIINNEWLEATGNQHLAGVIEARIDTAINSAPWDYYIVWDAKFGREWTVDARRCEVVEDKPAAEPVAKASRFIGLFTEDGLDQICEGEVNANREARDLRDMGCKVRVWADDDEAVLHAIDDHMRAGERFNMAVKKACADRDAKVEEPAPKRDTVEVIVKNNCSGEYVCVEVNALGWMDDGKEHGALLWGCSWDDLTVRLINDDLENSKVFIQQDINELTFKMHCAVRDFKKAALSDDAIEMAHIEHDVMGAVLQNLKEAKQQLASVEGEIAEMEVREILKAAFEHNDAPDLNSSRDLYTPRGVKA